MLLEPYGTLKPASGCDLFGGHEEAVQQQIAARAVKTKSRIQTRRATSEASLAEILPLDMAAGESWHVISGGNIDSMSYLQHMLKTQRMQYVLMSTWCMAAEDVAMIESWLDSGRIGRFDAYCGEIFPSQYAQVHADLCRVMRKHGGRVAILRNHSKIYAGIGEQTSWAIESSANVNTNPRIEQTAIHIDAGLANHYKDFFDGVKSFTRDFDDWTPWQET